MKINRKKAPPTPKIQPAPKVPPAPKAPAPLKHIKTKGKNTIKQLNDCKT